MKEVWKKVINYEDRYEVSNYGNVRSTINNRNKVLNKIKKKNGYYGLTLCKNNKKKNFLIHRIVAESFLGKSDLHVNHKDGNKLNNKISNLEYVTMHQNMQHASKNGLLKNRVGSESPVSKLDKNKVFLISFLFKHTLLSYKEIGGFFNVNRNTVSSIANGYNWSHLGVSKK